MVERFMFKKNLTKIIASVAALGAGVAATTAVANADTVYTVQSGDTLSGISMKFAKDTNHVNELAQKNNIKDVNLIYVGQKLLITSDGQIEQATAQQAATLPSANNTNTANNNASTSNNNATYASSVSGSDAAAKAWIAARESGGNYGARNGQYVGKYQLSASYLNGDYSVANQERAADQYVASRYGSWSAAKSFWQSHRWY